MPTILRQSTQIIVRVGSFVDSIDGATPETGITLGAADQAEALKAAGAATVDISGNTWAAITGADGWYNLTLTTTDTNTVGDLTIVVQDASVCLPVFVRFQVIEEALYDGIYAASAAVIPANVTQWQGSAPSALISGRVDANTQAMAAGVITASVVATDAIDADALADNAITAATFAAGAITATVIATDAIDADALADNAITAATFAAGAIDAAAIANGAIDAATFAAGAIDAAAIATGAIDADALATDAVNEIVDQVWDETLAGHLGAGSTGFALDAAASGGSAPSAAVIADAVWDELRAGHVGAGSFGEGVLLATGAVTAAAIATGAIDADAIASDAVTELRSIFSGTADSGTTTTLVDAALTESNGQAFEGMLILFTSGSNVNETRIITGFLPGLDQLTFAPTVTPAITTETYEILPVGRANVDTWRGSQIDNDVDGRVPATLGIAAGSSNALGTTTTMISPVVGVGDDYYKGMLLHFIEAPLNGQVRLITDLDVGTSTWTFTPAVDVAVPSGMGFEVLPWGGVDVRSWNGNPQNNLIAGRVDADVGAMQAGTITATVIATNAIDADALATDAVNEIVDQVWDEALAGHLAAGSTGEALDAAASGGSAPTAAAIADAVWDEALADHVAAGSMGFNENLIDDILADTNVIEPLVSTNLDATVSSRATPAQVNTEVDTALADIRLDELIQNAAAPADPTADSFIDLMTSKNAGQTFDRSTDSLEAIADSGGGGPTAGQIADAVWEEAIADHSGTVGSTAEALAAAAVGGSAPTVAQIADGVWDEVLAGHLTVGSTGAALDDAASGGAGLTPQQVADALKLAPAAGAPAAGSVYAEFDVLMGPGFNPATDSLEEIRDEVDACCGSGGGGEVINIEGI